MNPSVLCFGKIPVTKECMDKRGEYQDFQSKKFYLTVPKISVGGILQCFINFGYQRNICFRGLCHNFPFPVDFLLSHSAEIFVGETFCAVFQKNSGNEKVYG